MAMNLMDMDDVGVKVHHELDSVGSAVSLPYRQLGINCISLEIEHTESTYILPLSRVQTIQSFLKTLHSLPEIKAGLPKQHDVKPTVGDDVAYDEINKIADYFDEGSWIIKGYQNCIIRLQDWEDLLHNGASITIVVDPKFHPTQILPERSTEPLEPSTVANNDNHIEEDGHMRAVATNGWDTPPPLTRKNKSAISGISSSHDDSNWRTQDVNAEPLSTWNNESTVNPALNRSNSWIVEDSDQITKNKLTTSRWGSAINTQQESEDQNSTSDNASGTGKDSQHKWNTVGKGKHSNNNSNNNNQYKSSRPGPPRVFGSTKESPYLFTFIDHPRLPLSFPPDSLEYDMFEIDYPAGATYWELLKAVTYHYRIPRPKTHMASIDLTITQLKVEKVDGEECLVKASPYTALGSTLMKDVGVPKLKAGERLYMTLE